MNTTGIKEKLVRFIRSREARQAGSDVARLEELENSSDLYLLKRFAWTVIMYAAPITFLALPFAYNSFGAMLGEWQPFVWYLLQFTMVAVFLLLALTIYLTFGGDG